jgi:capping protein alpha
LRPNAWAEPLRKALHAQLDAYAQDHFADGAVVVVPLSLGIDRAAQPAKKQREKEAPVVVETTEESGETADEHRETQQAQEDAAEEMNEAEVEVEVEAKEDTPAAAVAAAEPQAEEEEQESQDAVDSETQGATRFVIHVVGNKYSLSNFWCVCLWWSLSAFAPPPSRVSQPPVLKLLECVLIPRGVFCRAGRWRATYTFDPAAAPASLEAAHQLLVHYFENGNVQLCVSSSRSLSLGNASASSSSPDADPDAVDALAARIAAALQAEEARFHASVERRVAELGERAFKALRRNLPVSKQKINWDKVSLCACVCVCVFGGPFPPPPSPFFLRLRAQSIKVRAVEEETRDGALGGAAQEVASESLGKTDAPRTCPCPGSRSARARA